jgi:hypothetical protein
MENELLNQAGAEEEFVEEDAGEITGTEPAAEPEGTEPTGEPEGTGAEEEEPSQESVDDEPMTNDEMAKQMKRLNDQVNSLQRRLSKQRREARPIIRQPEPIDESTAPKIEDFSTIEDYNQAYRNWEIDARIADGIRKATAGTSDEEIKAARADFVKEAMEDGSIAYQDFEKIVGNQTLPITVEILDAIRTETDSETVKPVDILYYLGKNPNEAAAISRMSKPQIAKSIVKIEARLEAAIKVGKGQAGPPPKKVGKTITEASAPIKSTDSTVIIHKDPDRMTQAEYEAWRLGGKS